MTEAIQTWSRPRVWVRGKMPNGEPTSGLISPSHMSVEDIDFDCPRSLYRLATRWRNGTECPDTLEEFFAPRVPFARAIKRANEGGGERCGG